MLSAKLFHIVNNIIGGDIMKISFSTLGCPGWSWNDMIATAKDLGFNGIEIRGIENELYVPKAKPFLSANVADTVKKLNRLGLEIPCLTSSCYLFDKENIELYLNEGKEYIDLASKLGTPFIRVLGDQNPEPGKLVDIDFVAQNLKILGEYAEQKNVMVLIETNGVFADSNKMLDLLTKVSNPNIGVLWDVHHPFRFMNEPVEKTYSLLKNYIKFVHLKDSIVIDGKVKYKMMGYGDVPVKDTVLLLKGEGFEGYVSLEWVKRWCIELEEPGIVFSQFANYMKMII